MSILTKDGLASSVCGNRVSYRGTVYKQRTRKYGLQGDEIFMRIDTPIDLPRTRLGLGAQVKVHKQK